MPYASSMTGSRVPRAAAYRTLEVSCPAAFPCCCWHVPLQLPCATVLLLLGLRSNAMAPCVRIDL